ncbi:Mbov_0396 family ICE element transmembrane protein [Mesomycoplasma hyopneumoniae]|uniref:Mbov_0396 family ICE element transmembrane protein n=1 Tax=Mesomycoplasma hyopneumoniae TaxID=2099 RepID=UPI001F237889|nr:hypothetical protein [Mesomycoplasma hyopneumoniae]UIF67248.1 hypothetical protein KUD10_01190 [Mesomycoplasma hyopneumoniae]
MFGWLINQISYAFFAGFWYLFCWFPLVIIRVITTLFGSINFNLLKGLFFGTSKEFSINKIPIAFWIFVGLAVSIFIFIVLYRLSKSFFFGSKNAYGQTNESEVKNIILKTLSAIGFPILFTGFLFILLIGSNIVLMEIKESLAYNNDLNTSLIKGASGDLKLGQLEISNLSKGSIVSYDAYTNFSWGQGPKLILLVLLSSLTVAWLLGTTLTSLVANIAQMFYQLLLLPVFSVSQISDDGKLFKKYLNSFWAKFWVVIIYQVSFLFFFVWTEYSLNAWDFIKDEKTEYGGIANWLLSFVFSLVMILGGGIAIKTISQEFAGYFGGEGFIRSQQEWAHRTAKGVVASAGLLAAAPAIARKQFRKGARLTGYFDSEKAKIKDDYRKGIITNTQRKLRLNELANKKAELGQTFRAGWNNNSDKNFLRRAWAAKEAWKESKDMGIIEGKGYSLSKTWSKITDWRAQRAQQKLDNLKNQLPDTDPKTLKQAQKLEKLQHKQEKANQKFAKRSKNLYETVQIRNDTDYRLHSSYQNSYDKTVHDKIAEKTNPDNLKEKKEDKKENNEKTNSK